MVASRHLLPLAAFLLPATLAGCRIDTEKHGDNKNVDIGTPFGSLHVKSDEGTAARTGLTPYPGATVVHKHGDDSGSADVNLNFGSFKLGVHATEMQTPDPQDKVLAFYRKDMGHFGAVITCRGSEAVGQPTRTAEGLTCDHEKHKISTEETSSDEMQLRAGSEAHQHIVGVHKEDGGTRIGLVEIDLPLGNKDHDGSNRE